MMNQIGNCQDICKKQWFLSLYAHEIFHCHFMCKLTVCLYIIDFDGDLLR
jgi:hypothetical protein